MRRALLLLAVPLLAVACGDDDAIEASDPTTNAPPPSYQGDASLPDPGGAPAALDVATALTARQRDEVRVVGHLIALPDGTAELCGGAVQESAPPRCADPALPVDGLTDPTSVAGAHDVGGWVEGDVVLTGRIDGGRLAVGDA